MRRWVSGLLFILASSAALPVQEDLIMVKVDLARAVGQVDPRFLSVTVDSSQLVGSTFWGQSGEFHFNNSVLIQLASALAPAYLRVGGTDGDKIFYDFSTIPTTQPPPGYSEVLNETQFDALVAFVKAVGFELVFGLNGGPGPRGGSNQPWTPNNARIVLERAKQLGAPLAAVELSNEPNLFFANFGLHSIVTPHELARDYGTLRQLVSSVLPDVKIAGPDVAFQLPFVGELVPFLPDFAKAVGDNVDVLTYHWYPLDSERCPAAKIDPLTARHPTQLISHSLRRRQQQHIAAATRDVFQRPVWLGETSSVSCGGAKNISNAFASTLWWAVELGMAAVAGNEAVMRQTLSGSVYGLIDGNNNFTPNPDYWLSVLYRRIVGVKVLSVQHTRQNDVDVFAHCANGVSGAVALLLVNSGRTNQTVSADITHTASQFDVYSLTAQDLTSRTVLLNGNQLHADASGKLPTLPPIQRAPGPVPLPPYSVTFVVVHGSFDVCVA